MSSDQPRRKLVRLAALVPLFALAPLTLSPTDGIRENRACADDACVEVVSDFCYVDGNVLWDYANYDGVE